VKIGQVCGENRSSLIGSHQYKEANQISLLSISTVNNNPEKF
jgi:hypothetical protein